MTAHPLRASQPRRRPAPTTANGDPPAGDVVGGVFYPSSDGKPMAETLEQWRALVTDSAVLEQRYAHDPNVLVAGDILVYPEEGNHRRCVAPDILVALGVPKRTRLPSYKVWVEGKAPDFVLEVASPGTWQEDRGRKWREYAEMGVRECWLFDPSGDFFDPRLEGYRLVGGEYQPLDACGDALESKVLGLRLRPDGGHVRFHDPATGADLRTLAEETAERRQAEEKAAQANARVAELEAQIRQLQSQYDQ